MKLTFREMILSTCYVIENMMPLVSAYPRIEPVLRDYGHYFQKNYSGKFQLVVVLNGCRDNTRGVVERVHVGHTGVVQREDGAEVGVRVVANVHAVAVHGPARG